MDPSMVFCRRSIVSPLQRTDLTAARELLTDVVLLGIIICLRCPLFHSLCFWLRALAGISAF